jgi:hypothetical protein
MLNRPLDVLFEYEQHALRQIEERRAQANG